jgi:YHS domain-containing protein
MKRDPVCGIHIHPADALRLEYHGRTYYFCSHPCKRQFEDRPDEYAEHLSSTALHGLMIQPIQVLATAMQEGEG